MQPLWKKSVDKCRSKISRLKAYPLVISLLRGSFFFHICQRKILVGQKILFGFKIEFLYWCIYVFHLPLESVHQFMHYASHLFSLFGHSMPSHFALQYLFIFLTISCISIRVNTDVTSLPVNHCCGWLFEMDWADTQTAPLLSMHLNRPVWCGQRRERGHVQREWTTPISPNSTHEPIIPHTDL